MSSSSSVAAELKSLLERSNGAGLTTREILEIMQTRGIALLMVLFAAPFLLPVSIPGTSTPFGLMLGILGITMILAAKPWVPGFLGNRRVPHASLEKVVSILLRFFQKLERWLRIRHSFWTDGVSINRLHGLYVLFLAAVLAIPFPPVPFFASNSIAAWPIFLLGLGLLERDGLFVAIAYAWLLPFCLYWLFFWVVARAAFEAIFSGSEALLPAATDLAACVQPWSQLVS